MTTPVMLKGFAVELPRYCGPQSEALVWLAAAHARAESTAAGSDDLLPELQQRMNRLVTRYSCSPEHIGSRRSELRDFTHLNWHEMQIFNLHESPRGGGLDARSRFFAEAANRAVQALFAEDSDPPSDLFHVSCTGYVSPSAIQRLIELKGWNTRTRPTQVYHMGCYAAVPALRLASGVLSPDSEIIAPRVEIVHTELCTLHFNPGDHSPGQLVVQSLFADGHIRYSLARGGDGTLEVLSIREQIVPASLEDMAWTLSEWGFRMTLSRDVPQKVAACLRSFMQELFRSAGLNYESCAGDAVFAVHPGGPRIIDSVQQLLGLQPHQLALSRAVLFERGNMSSATLPHVWMAAASDPGVRPGTLIASVAFGPGLTIAGALFRKTGDVAHGSRGA